MKSCVIEYKEKNKLGCRLPSDFLFIKIRYKLVNVLVIPCIMHIHQFPATFASKYCSHICTNREPGMPNPQLFNCLVVQ